ncbi:MAG: MgtC/SapB transporter, partial [Xanthobacteraceae bacterium]|nr:MgtC/SapB transporter [Xanthobacteraceae bacterium]
TRGELVAGTIGGVVSSTATTVANARRSIGQETVLPLAAGAISAGGVSLVRTGFLVFTLAPSLATMLIVPLLAGAAVMFAYALLLARRPAQPREEKPTPKNPFDLDSVIKMALLLVGVAFLARAASEVWGASGLYLASVLSGLADVDAVTVTVAGMLTSLTEQTAATAIGLAILSNMVAKAAYAAMFGAKGFVVNLWIASAVAIAVAIAMFGVVNGWLA